MSSSAFIEGDEDLLWKFGGTNFGREKPRTWETVKIKTVWRRLTAHMKYDDEDAGQLQRDCVQPLSVTQKTIYNIGNMSVACIVRSRAEKARQHAVKCCSAGTKQSHFNIALLMKNGFIWRRMNEKIDRMATKGNALRFLEEAVRCHIVDSILQAAGTFYQTIFDQAEGRCS